MDRILRFLFWPNPGGAHYSSPSMLALLGVSAALVVLWFVLRLWRKKTQNPMTRKLSASWSGAALGFGIAGFILVVARVEGIQFIAMRFLWVLWGLVGLAYLFLQFRLWRARHYEVLPQVRHEDPLEKYLPQRKK